MNDKPKDDYPTQTEKENMDEPQEEFISIEPPSATKETKAASEKDPVLQTATGTWKPAEEADDRS